MNNQVIEYDHLPGRRSFLRVAMYWMAACSLNFTLRATQCASDVNILSTTK